MWTNHTLLHLSLLNVNTVSPCGDDFNVPVY